MTASLFGVGASIVANVNGTLVPQRFVGTTGQTLFNITNFTYVPGTNSILVFINGQKQNTGSDFTETSGSSITLLEGVVAGDFVDVIGFPELDLTAVTLGSITLGGSYSLQQYINDSDINVKAYPYLASANGVTNDTAAITAAIAMVKLTGGTLYFPPGTYAISSLLFNGSGYQLKVSEGALFKQIAGQPVETYILNFIGKDITVKGDLKGIGNIATDTGEFNHFVGVFDLTHAATIQNISFDNIYGTDIRGDVLYVSGLAATPTTGIKFNTVSGSNVYRNLVSVVGGQVSGNAIIQNGPVGRAVFDVEPNAGGIYQPGSLIVNYVKGASVTVSSGDSAINNDLVQIGYFDANLNYGSQSTPAYPSGYGVNSAAILLFYCSLMKIGYMKCRNYNGIPIIGGTAVLKSNLQIDVLDVVNCNITEAVFNSIIADQGTGGMNQVEIGNLLCTLTGTAKMVFNGNGMKVRVRSGIVSGGLLSAAIPFGQYENMSINMNGSAGVLLSACNDSVLTNVTVTNAAAGQIMMNAARNTFMNFNCAVTTMEGAGCSENRLIHSTVNNIKYTYDYVSGAVLAKAMADANQVLTNIESTAVLLRPSGALTAQRNLVVSTVPRVYNIDNGSTGFGVQIIGATGTGIVVGIGKKAIVMHDGTNVIRLTADI